MRCHVQHETVPQRLSITDSSMDESPVAESRDGETNSRRESRAADLEASKGVGSRIVLVEIVAVKNSRIVVPFHEVVFPRRVNLFDVTADEEEVFAVGESAMRTSRRRNIARWTESLEMTRRRKGGESVTEIQTPYVTSQDVYFLKGSKGTIESARVNHAVGLFYFPNSFL